MKKAIIIVGAIFILLLVSLVALPFIFKDKIIARIDKEIANSINATVYYDLDQISLSVFKRFPNISATVGQFGIVGNEPFQADTLIHLDELQVDFNLRSVLFGDIPSLTGIHLNGGSLYVKVLEDGRANYDITYPSEEVTEPSNFQIAIDLLEVNDFDLVHDDRSLDFLMVLGQIQASGKGNFTADVYDLPLEMQALIGELAYGGTSYLSKKNFKGSTILQVDMGKMRFSFADGEFGINDFLFGLEGFIAMPTDDIEFDLAFGGKNNTFKSILSLVPGMYTESFANLKTSGTMDFNGKFKGIYNDTSFPAFDIALLVKDGMFQYPDLPRPVSDVNVDLQIKNETSNLENTSVNIPVFNLKFGNNPISGKFLLGNLVSYPMEGNLKGKLDLGELTSIFPVEGMTLKGILDVNAEAKGSYDANNQTMPAISANLNLSNGFVQNTDYPAALEALQVKALISNPSGNMKDFLVDLSQFGFKLENEQIDGRLKITDFDGLNWDGAVKGAVDLGKMLAIFPIENTTMSGKIGADIQTKGSYKDVEAAQYNKLDTRGNMSISNFAYTSADLPQGIKINAAQADFTPERISLTQFDSQIGKSPLQASGFLSNYMNYLLQDDQTLKGQLSLNSSRFDVNEWMTESASTDSEALTVIELPTNIDFSMSVAAAEVIYDNLNLKEVKGNMTLRDGVLRFSEASMSALGGRIIMNGSYDPRDVTAPKFDFGMNLANLSIPQAFQAFNTVKAFAPIAQHMTGNFNTNLSFSGKLGQDMMPVLSSIFANGLVKVSEASYQNSNLVQGITSLTRLNDTNTLQLRDLNIPIDIQNGILEVKPFNVKLWDYQANIQGSTGFDGSINYLINMQVPAGKFGAQANALLAGISGGQADENTMIPVALNLGGTYASPKVGLAGGNSIETLLANSLKARVSSETANIQQQVTDQFKATEDSIKRELKLKADMVQDSLQKEAEKKLNVTKDKAVEEGKKLIRGLLNPKQPAKPDTTKNDGA